MLSTDTGLGQYIITRDYIDFGLKWHANGVVPTVKAVMLYRGLVKDKYMVISKPSRVNHAVSYINEAFFVFRIRNKTTDHFALELSCTTTTTGPLSGNHD